MRGNRPLRSRAETGVGSGRGAGTSDDVMASGGRIVAGRGPRIIYYACVCYSSWADHDGRISATTALAYEEALRAFR